MHACTELLMSARSRQGVVRRESEARNTLSCHCILIHCRVKPRVRSTEKRIGEICLAHNRLASISGRHPVIVSLFPWPPVTEFDRDVE